MNQKISEIVDAILGLTLEQTVQLTTLLSEKTGVDLNSCQVGGGAQAPAAQEQEKVVQKELTITKVNNMLEAIKVLRDLVKRDLIEREETGELSLPAAKKLLDSAPCKLVFKNPDELPAALKAFAASCDVK